MTTPNQVLTLSEPIAIIGVGVAGLINAHVLLQDGFKNVHVITRDPTVGGVWARQRVYPGLRINNVHGEYRFSAMEMPPPAESAATGGRLSGLDMCNYFEGYYEKFLKGKVEFKFNTEVLDVSRGEDGLWTVQTKNTQTQTTETLSFSRIILATGGCSEPYIPGYLSQATAEKCQYRGIVAHSSEFFSRGDEIMTSIKERSGNDESPPVVVVVGGGKSAQDACIRLTEEGFKCVNVFDRGDSFLASTSPLPTFIRRGRFLSLLSPHIHLRTWLERMLHGTVIGGKIVRYVWNKLEADSFDAFEIPRESPLRRTFSLFWGVRTSDAGVALPNSYHTLANSNKIEIIAPARAVGFASDGRSILLDNGRSIAASALVVATGYQSSWPKIFSDEMAEELGINKHAPTTKVTDTWDYTSLSGAPPAHPDGDKWVTSLHRGIIPAKNILRRDFAIAGTMFSANAGYTNEVVAHWISSYFLGDEMRLPSDVEEAMAESERAAVWMKRRYPIIEYWNNPGHMGRLDFWSWPQAADDLLEDMGLPSHRSGGNWLTWPFKVIEMKELASLGDERRAKRLEMSSRL